MVFGLKKLRRKLSRDKGTNHKEEGIQPAQPGENEPIELAEQTTSKVESLETETQSLKKPAPMISTHMVNDDDEEDSKEQFEVVDLATPPPIKQNKEEQIQVELAELPPSLSDDNSDKKSEKIELLKKTLLKMTLNNNKKGKKKKRMMSTMEERNYLSDSKEGVMEQHDEMDDDDGDDGDQMHKTQNNNNKNKNNIIIHEYPIINEQLSFQITDLMRYSEKKINERDQLNHELTNLEEQISRKTQNVIPELQEKIDDYTLSNKLNAGSIDENINEKQQLIQSTLNQLSEWKANNIVLQRQIQTLTLERKLIQQQIEYQSLKLSREQKMLFREEEEEEEQKEKKEKTSEKQPTVTKTPSVTPPPADV